MKPDRTADAGGSPEVTVVVPTHNHAQFVGDAIESVLQQGHRAVEVIVVDDGSEDATASVVARFGQRVCYVAQPRGGLASARNTGIRRARGAYIGVLDADDMYEPEFLHTLLGLLRADPAAHGAYCGYQLVDRDGRPLPQRCPAPPPNEQVHAVLLGGNFLVPEALLLSRQCYETLGLFDSALDACEDWDMWLRVASRYRLVGTTRVLTRHRVLPHSMSSDPARMHRARLAVLEKHGGRQTRAGLGAAMARAHLRSAVEYLERGDDAQALECVCRMATAHPPLLSELEPWYELACGHQARGYHGDLDSVDLERSASTLAAVLDRVFDAAVPGAAAGARRRAFGNAFFCLGLLAYGARRLRPARRFLGRALRSDPRLAWNPRWLRTLGASLWLAATGLPDRPRGARRASGR